MVAHSARRSRAAESPSPSSCPIRAGVRRERQQSASPAAFPGRCAGAVRLQSRSAASRRRRGGCQAGREAPANAPTLDESKLPPVDPLRRRRPRHEQERLHRLRRLRQRQVAGGEPDPGRPHHRGARSTTLAERSLARAAPAGRAGRGDARTPPASRRSSATSGPPAWTRPRSTRRASTPLKADLAADRRAGRRPGHRRLPAHERGARARTCCSASAPRPTSRTRR